MLNYQKLPKYKVKAQWSSVFFFVNKEVTCNFVLINQRKNNDHNYNYNTIIIITVSITKCLNMIGC